MLCKSCLCRLLPRLLPLTHLPFHFPSMILAAAAAHSLLVLMLLTLTADACNIYYIDQALQQLQDPSSSDRSPAVIAVPVALCAAIIAGVLFLVVLLVRRRRHDRRLAKTVKAESSSDLESGIHSRCASPGSAAKPGLACLAWKPARLCPHTTRLVIQDCPRNITRRLMHTP